MKIKNTLMGMIMMLGMASCQMGPTAICADGTKVTLGVDVGNQESADIRSVTMPNGLKMNWARNMVNNSAVLTTAETVIVPEIGLVKIAQSNNTLKGVQSVNSTKQVLGAQNAAVKTTVSNNTTAVQEAAIAKGTTTIPH